MTKRKIEIELTDVQVRGLLFLLGGRHQQTGLDEPVVDALGDVEAQVRAALAPPPAPEPLAAGSLGG